MNESGGFDLAVIGGGIHGCAVARDASRRGLSVALFERDDLASATSSASSKLAHGGLRYLEDLRLRLVREGLCERGQLLRNAPHLTRPLSFLLPVYENGPWGKWMLQTGLRLYDWMGRNSQLGGHRWLEGGECLELEPGLRAEGLRGAFHFFDAQVDDARLCVENALDAHAHGAVISTRSEVIGLLAEGATVRGVRVRDQSGVHEVSTRCVVNCAGPWVARVSDGQDLARRPQVRWSRGSHLVMSRRTNGHALLLRAPQDGRVVFVIPFKGRTLLGTTEVEVRSAVESPEPSPQEVEYLLECSRYYLPRESAESADILHAFAGLRTLPGDDDTPLGHLTREARVEEDAPGLLTLVGGKLTSHRATAAAIVDRLGARLDRKVGESDTLRAPYPGAGGPEMNEYFEVAEDLLFKRYPQTDLGVLRHLLGSYGSRHLDVLREFDRDPTSATRIESRFPFTQAEVNVLVRDEWARSVDDLVRRRTYRIFLGDFGQASRRSWQLALDRAIDRVVS